MSGTAGGRQILIIGAGIAGLSIAALLTKHRIPFQLFESSDQNSEAQGYGITLRRWGYEPLVRALGVPLEDFIHAVACDGAVGGVGRIASSMIDAANGAVLVPDMADGREGHIRANRGKIREWLIQHIDPSSLQWGKKVCAVACEKDFATVTFEDGSQASCAMLIAADGIHSAGVDGLSSYRARLTRTARKTLAPSCKPEMIDAVVYIWQTSMSRASFDENLGKYFEKTNVLVGVCDNKLIGPSIVELGADHVKMSWTLSRPLSENDKARGIGSDVQSARALFDEERAALEVNTEPYKIMKTHKMDERVDDLYLWRIRSLRFPRDELVHAADLSAIFVGDAAHAMPIFAGEGGNHAMLDAVDLCNIIALNPSLPTGHLATAFYDGAGRRWMKGIEDSEAGIQRLHKPLGEWRAISDARKAQAQGSAA